MNTKLTRVVLPVRVRGELVSVGFYHHTMYFSYGATIYHFFISKKLIYSVIGLLCFVLCQQILHPRRATYVPATMTQIDRADADDVLAYSMDELERVRTVSNESAQNVRDRFNVEKQMLVSQCLIKEKASRIDQLSDAKLLELNRSVSQLFVSLVLNSVKAAPHVYKYFTDTTDLKKIETSLMEQAKYHVPASIKLAQSALETAYGKRVISNNYFGIKDKSEKSDLTLTTEYYTSDELKVNQLKVVSKERVFRNGRMLYKCKVKDYFSEFDSPWASFRAHSIFLNQNYRYSPLFTKGRDYRAWADKIGSTKYGGVGYATSPIYGQLLKTIIERYHLDLLDY